MMLTHKKSPFNQIPPNTTSHELSGWHRNTLKTLILCLSFTLATLTIIDLIIFYPQIKTFFNEVDGAIQVEMSHHPELARRVKLGFDNVL